MFKPLKVPCLQTLDELKAKCKRLGLRMILPDHLKPVKHKRNREETPEDLVKKTKRFKIEIEQLTKNHLQMLGMINKKDSQENDRPLNGLAEIGLIQQNGVLQLNSKLNDMTNGKLINGGIVIENAKIECNGVWHSNGRLRNVRLDFNKLCKGVPEDENQKQPDQIMIIEGLELDKVEREKSKNHSPEIIEIDLMSEDDEEKPSEILITPTPMPTIVEEPPPSTPANVKPVSRFYKKDDLGNMQRFVKNLNNYAELTKAFSHLIELKKYADELNAQIVKCKPVAVVNDVDLEMPPKFTYTNGYDLSMLDQSVRTKIAEDVQKCNCVHDCAFYLSKNVATCCYSSYSDSCFYTVSGKIKNQNQLSKRGPIVECTEFCTCSKQCPNRVIQQGTQVPLAIFKTDNGRGWGLKALEKISKNTFICTYRGQVISSEEAVERQKTFPLKDRYFFNLDYNEELEFEYVVDATNISNIGRFLNHSCLPNCETFIAYVESAFLKIPVIAFFTNRQIQKDEELTIDYFIDAEFVPSADNRDNPDSKINCLCGSENCRKHPFN